MNLLRRYNAWRLKRLMRRNARIQAEYEALSEAEKADHYWKGRGL